MPTVTGKTIVCSSCGKKYIWKPELAGKSVRCKCGQLIPVPPATPAKPEIARREATGDDDLYDLASDPEIVAPKTKSSPAPIAAPVSVPGLEDDMYRCPSCSEGMVPGAIICSACGFNLKTGEKVAINRPGAKPAPASTSKKSSTAFGIPGRAKPPVVVDDNKGQLLKLLIPLALVLIVAGGIIGFKMMAGGKPAAPVSTNKDDMEVARLTDEGGATEIHKWFKDNSQRMAGEWSPKQAIGKADELQDMGAKQVLAFGAMMTRSIAVELPDKPDQRAELFKWENKFAREHHYPVATDQGQKYLLLNLGL